MDHPTVDTSRDHFIQGITRIAQFWGFPKGMGAVYAAIYLSPAPLSLNETTTQAGITKGAVSTHVRALERLGMIHKKVIVGDRRDFYEAETDFGRMIQIILREREKPEFDKALRSVGESLDMFESIPESNLTKAEKVFYADRLSKMKRLFDRLDQLVAMIIAMDDVKNSALAKLFTKLKP